MRLSKNMKKLTTKVNKLKWVLNSNDRAKKLRIKLHFLDLIFLNILLNNKLKL